jgi:hypothetical protein
LHGNQLFFEWLKNKDQEAERLRDASQEEQIEIARSASPAAERAAVAAERASAAAERQAIAAERANARASIALVIAIISIVATAIGIWIVHRDTLAHASSAQSISNLLLFSSFLASSLTASDAGDQP